MKVKQILNNNAVVALKGKEEMIMVGTGIGFHKKAGDLIFEREIDKTFILSSHKMVEDFARLMKTTSQKNLDIVNQVMSYATGILHTEIYDFVYIAFLEHMEYAIQRVRQNISLKSPLSYDVRRFYHKEFRIGQYAVALINDAYDISMDQEEAVQIALHFVNNQSSRCDVKQVVKMTEIVSDILRIIRITTNNEIDESNMDSQRLIIHLQYFAKRIITKEKEERRNAHGNVDNEKFYLANQRCIDAIEIYLLNTYQYIITCDERLYLAIHIHRCISQDSWLVTARAKPF